MTRLLFLMIAAALIVAGCEGSTSSTVVPASSDATSASAANLDNSEAMLKLGQVAFLAGDWEGARVWFEKAATLGNTDAMGALGGLAEMEAGDPEAGRGWWEKAASLGDSDAMFALGSLAKEAGDLDAARGWWEKAANHGHPDAARFLAELDASSN